MVKSKDDEVRLSVNSSFILYWLNDLGWLLSLSKSQSPLLWNGNDGSVDLQWCGESLVSWWSPYLAQCPAHPKHSVSVGSSCYCWDEPSHTLPCRIDGQHNSRGCHCIEPKVVNKDSAVELCKRPLVPAHRQPSFFTLIHSRECAPLSCGVPTVPWVCKSASIQSLVSAIALLSVAPAGPLCHLHWAPSWLISWDCIGDLANSVSGVRALSEKRRNPKDVKKRFL